MGIQMETDLSTIEKKYDTSIKNLQRMKNEFTSPELSQIAKMASISSAVMKEFPEFSFVGFYIVQKYETESFLEVGPYVAGIIATPRIGFGKGVCGETWERKETMIVNNVRACNNYIACSKNVMSEIVVPVLNKDNECTAVLHIDCTIKDRFTDLDKEKLEYVIKTFC